MMRTRALTGVALLLLVAVLAACSGADAAQPSIDPATADVQMSASNVAFDQATVTVPAGKAFTIAFTNHDSMPHNVAIKDANGAKAFTGDVVTNGVDRLLGPLPGRRHLHLRLRHPPRDDGDDHRPLSGSTPALTAPALIGRGRRAPSLPGQPLTLCVASGEVLPYEGNDAACPPRLVSEE